MDIVEQGVTSISLKHESPRLHPSKSYYYLSIIRAMQIEMGDDFYLYSSV